MPKGDHGGSASGGGHDFQSNAFAFVACHALSEHPLAWFNDLNDVPVAIAMETGGAGDDLRIELLDSCHIELQVKHGLQRGADLWDALFKLIDGIEQNSALRGVLLVDGSSSGTVKEDLRLDIERLGNGRDDDLKPISTDFLARFKTRNMTDLKVLRRLRIAIADFYDGSTGVTAATALLINLLKSPKDTRTAWKVLSNTGLIITRDRCRRDCASLLGLLRPHVEFAEKTECSAVVLDRYRAWVEGKEATFYVHVLRHTLPVSSAWNRLRFMEAEAQNEPVNKTTLARQIASYHEWGKLADSRHVQETLEAEDILLQTKHSVFVGGPGAGKSTVLSRIAHWATKDGKSVLHVSLKTVRQLLNTGKTFEESIVLAGSDGSGIDQPLAMRMLSYPDFLLADGLDECDPERATIASKITSWCIGHPRCRVCVTTRPIGHAPDILPGFRHAELLPLDSGAVKHLSASIINIAVAEPERQVKLASEFEEKLDKARNGQGVAHLASRNPLLLSFLVSLFLAGEDFGKNRASLFDKIIDMFSRSPISRTSANEDTVRGLANLALDHLGWVLVSIPETEVKLLITSIAQVFQSNTKMEAINAQCKAEQTINYWESRNLIERLLFAHIEVLTFIHPVLGEYAAGRHLSKMASDEISDWLHRHSRLAKWRQPIQLACSCGATEKIVPCLLALDDPADPCSTESILAAYGLAETAEPSQHLVQAVAEKTAQRLLSTVPILAIEATDALLGLSRIAPDLVKPIALNLVEHEQSWTRLAALTLALESCPKEVRLETVIQWLTTFRPASAFIGIGVGTLDVLPPEAYDIQKSTLENAVRKLCEEAERLQARSVIETLLNNKCLSIGMIYTITEVAVAKGFEAEVEAIEKKRKESSGFNWDKLLSINTPEDKLAAAAFLSGASLAIGGTASENCSPKEKPFSELSKLFDVMGFWEAILPAWYVLGYVNLEEELAEVMRGCIDVAGIDAKELRRDIEAVSRKLIEEDFSFGSLLEHSCVRADWSLADLNKLDKIKITKALCHPSPPIVETTARLFGEWEVGPEWQLMLKLALYSDNPHTLRALANNAFLIWKADALTVLLGRLDNPCSGCEHIYERVVRLATKESRADIVSQVLKGLSASIPSVACSAAEVLRDSGWEFDEAVNTEFMRAMKHWSDEAKICDRAAPSGSCKGCHTVCCSPRVPLIQLLSRTETLGADVLTDLAQDKRTDVAKASQESLARMATKDEALMISLLDLIIKGDLPMGLLDAVLSLPQAALSINRVHLRKLLTSENITIRIKLIGSLSAGWLPAEDVKDALKTALSDKVPKVRDKAARVARLVFQEDLHF